MAKLMNRSRERVLMRKHTGPTYTPWSDWAECAGTNGLTEAECKTLLKEWSFDAQSSYWTGNVFTARGRYEIEQYRIVDDKFDVDSYNVALKE